MMPGAVTVPALLAIDAGSSRTRVTLLSAKGEALAVTAAKTPSLIDGPGAVLSAEALWQQVVRLVRQVRPADCDLAGIAVAAQLGAVLVDESGAALSDALLWPDRRAAAHVGELKQRLGAAANGLGRPVSAELPACKVLWWAEHAPDALERARWVLSLKDYLVMRLTGVAVTDETHASYTGLFDVAAREYGDDIVCRSGIDRSVLPPVRGAAAPAGELVASAAGELGVTPGVCVAVGCPDGTAGALGAGAVGPGVTVDVAGTTDVLLSVVNQPRWHRGGGAILNAYALAGQWAVGGPTGMTGGALEWVSRLLGFESAAEAFARLGAEVLALPVGADGLSFDPALSGSRFPAWNSAESGVITGLHSHHSAAHLLRAAHEGAAFSVGEGIDALRSAGYRVDEVVIVGGVATQPQLVRMRSELWAVPVRVLDGGQEATTVGTAMLAGLACGVFSDAEHAAGAMVAQSVRIDTGDTRRDEVSAARKRWHHAAAFARR